MLPSTSGQKPRTKPVFQFGRQGPGTEHCGHNFLYISYNTRLAKARIVDTPTAVVRDCDTNTQRTPPTRHSLPSAI